MCGVLFCKCATGWKSICSVNWKTFRWIDVRFIFRLLLIRSIYVSVMATTIKWDRRTIRLHRPSTWVELPVFDAPLGLHTTLGTRLTSHIKHKTIGYILIYEELIEDTLNWKNWLQNFNFTKFPYLSSVVKADSFDGRYVYFLKQTNKVWKQESD